MQLVGDWIKDSDLQAVLRILTAAGHQALLVGGCVRNGLLGLPVDDIDIATNARPERVIALATTAGLRVVPTGVDHGTVTIVAGGKPHEVTTFRRDVETDGRRAVVTFADTIDEDAARRDFTMNALYANADGVIIDPLGGLPDLLSRRLRFVGRPEDRIREDYLRILRFFRFYARYGDPTKGIDPEGLAACAANSDGIETLSRERVGHEMRKLLAAHDPAPSIAAMQAAGVLAQVLPGADARSLAPLVHLEQGTPGSAMRRLAAIGGEDPAGALRLSKDEAKHLLVLRDEIGTQSPAGELAYRYGADIAQDILFLRGATFGQALASNWKLAVAKGAAAKFPVSAADIADRFSGPAMGRRLRELEAKWIASDFELSRSQLIA